MKKKRSKVKRMVDQAKEPLSLLETLKEEGLARAGYLLGVASLAAKNINAEKVVDSLREGAQAVGLVRRQDLEKLQERIQELEERVEELEARAAREEE